ncbi:MAG: hypothetical protein FWG13_04960 [Leptospirales bacterium]|nr:hypothetical protein [Leptospirales bacterium]
MGKELFGTALGIAEPVYIDKIVFDADTVDTAMATRASRLFVKKALRFARFSGSAPAKQFFLTQPPRCFSICVQKRMRNTFRVP